MSRPRASILRRLVAAGLLAAGVIAGAGCAPGDAARHFGTIDRYYEWDLPEARARLRADAYVRNDEQVVLNNLRLGLAALADGDPAEAERTLGRVFDLLSTAGLNADRTAAAAWINEGIRVWKGEPFEQALAYHYVSTLYATKGDWENARAAAANSLFRLTDFGADQDPEQLVRRAAEDEGYLDEGYTAVDTDFALGFLMQAIASDRSGVGGADALLDAAVRIDPELAPVADAIASRRYDTLLIVDYGKGPTKVAFGPDGALVRFDPAPHAAGPLIVQDDGHEYGRFPAACRVDDMARDHRWNNLEDLRRAKSFIGDLLIMSGVILADHGGHHRDDGQSLVGIGLILGGMLAKSSARGDTRHLEMLPKTVYVVPLELGGTTDLRVGVGGDAVRLPRFRPGTLENPRAVYLRLHGPAGPRPSWLAADRLVYGNDHDGVRPGDFPWILGGHDVSTPTRETLAAYQAGGHLLGWTLNDLRDLYRAEGIVIGAGMENRPDAPKNPSYRHVLEGGTGLFTPAPDSMGYKRLMYTPRPPYRPRSDAARAAAARPRSEPDPDPDRPVAMEN